MFIKNGYVIDPPTFLVPAYSISPFCRCAAKGNSLLGGGPSLNEYLERRFGGMPWRITRNARGAIGEVLRHLQLQKEDNVAIFTTTGNAYISGCVTREIEQYCGWGRAIDHRTRAILVNHEFGFPCEDFSRFKGSGIPIIEDFAHSFFSTNADRSTGTVGDYLVFSFSKMFPIQLGGLVVSREPLPGEEAIGSSTRDYIQRIVGHWVVREEEIRGRRRANHDYLETRFKSLGCLPRFKMEEHHIPGVYMFTVEPRLDLELMKRHFQANGVESSVFYPEQAFYLPVHQQLDRFDLDFFFALAETFLERNHGAF